jgi:hypothetical protein
LFTLKRGVCTIDVSGFQAACAPLLNTDKFPAVAFNRAVFGDVKTAAAVSDRKK